MNKNSRSNSTKTNKHSHINKARKFRPMQNPFSFGKSISNLSSSKIFTKETDAYCDLSVSYTSDFPDHLCTEVILSNARSSLIDLRTEAQMYIDSSKRAVMKKNRESIFSCPEALHRHSASNTEQISQLMSSINESMKDVREKLEKVEEKQVKRDEESRNIKESILELKDKIDEIRAKKKDECSKMCEII